MKKIITLFACMLLLGLSQQVKADYYIIGDLDGYSSWNLTSGAQMTETGEDTGVYEATVTIAESSGGIGYFAIASQLMEDNNDWDTFNSNYRYGGEWNGYTLTSGVSAKLVKWSELNYDNSFALAVGEYTIVVDANDSTIMATSTIAAEESMYIIGDLDGYSWSVTSGYKMTETEEDSGVYEATVTITESSGGVGYFLFATQLMASEDWDAFNSNYRYGGEWNSYPLLNGVPAKLVKWSDIGYDNSFALAAGEYSIVVDTNEATVTATSTSGSSLPLYILGSITDSDWIASGVKMTETYNGSRVYETVVTIEADDTSSSDTTRGEFRFTVSENTDWDGGSFVYFGAGGVDEGTTYWIGRSADASATLNYLSEVNFSVEPGTYRIIADLVNSTVEVYDAAMYIIGDIDNIAAWDPSSGVEMSWNGDGIFTAECTIVGGEGSGISSLGYVGFGPVLGSTSDDWYTFNASRYGASTYNRVVAPDSEVTLSYSSTYSFGLAGGTYYVTFNLKEKTVTFSPKSYITYSFPEKIYLIGDIDNASGWVTTTGLEVTETEEGSGIYKATITVTSEDSGEGWFGLGATVTEEEDWTTFNAYRYNPVSSAYLSAGEVADIDMMGDGNSFEITSGKYDLTIQLTSIGAGTILLENPGGSTGVTEVVVSQAAYPVVIGDEISVVGDAENVRIYSIGGALVGVGTSPVACTEGVYIVVIDGVAYKVMVK